MESISTSSRQPSEVFNPDEPYSVVQVGEDKEAMKKEMELRYQRRLAQKASQGEKIKGSAKTGGNDNKKQGQAYKKKETEDPSGKKVAVPVPTGGPKPLPRGKKAKI